MLGQANATWGYGREREREMPRTKFGALGLGLRQSFCKVIVDKVDKVYKVRSNAFFFLI